MTLLATSETPSLRVTEIFLSLQGETNRVGLPTVFVRLTGCPLRCSYCDTAYAFHGGTVQPLNEVVDSVMAFGVQHVTVTGGEPMAQPNVAELLRRLADVQFDVSLETSGALDLQAVDPRIAKIVDIKTPSSGEMARNLWSNLDLCTTHDQVKFVIGDASDYDWARLQCDRFSLHERVGEVLFSPCVPQMSATQLADWIVRDRLRVRMQVQLHKLLWGNEPGR